MFGVCVIAVVVLFVVVRRCLGCCFGGVCVLSFGFVIVSFCGWILCIKCCLLARFVLLLFVCMCVLCVCLFAVVALFVVVCLCLSSECNCLPLRLYVRLFAFVCFVCFAFVFGVLFCFVCVRCWLLCILVVC